MGMLGNSEKIVIVLIAVDYLTLSTKSK